MYNEIKELTTVLAKDSFNPQINFDLGVEYEKINQTASAAGFYLRAAEYSYESNKDLSYLSILKTGICFENQGSRDWSSSNNFLQAIAYAPERPEAYYYLGKHQAKKGNWQEAYTNYAIALNLLNNIKPSSFLPFSGKVDIDLAQTSAAYFVGRISESIKTIKELINTSYLSVNQFNEVFGNAKNLGIKFDKIAIVLPVRNNNSYRAERLKSCIYSWRQQTEGLSDIHIIIDEDEVNQFEFLKEYPFVTVHIRPNMKLIPKVNSIAVQLADVYEYIAFVGDDIMFKTPWESRFIEYFKSIPAGLAYANTMDRDNVNEFGSHPVISSNLVRTLGFYGCPAVDHTYFDNFWMDLCTDIGYKKYFDDILWNHSRDNYEPDQLYWEIVAGQPNNELKYNEYKLNGYQTDLDKVKGIIQ